MERVAPYCVLSYGIRDAWFDDVVAIGYHLALLAEAVVSVGILQRHNAVFARGDAPHDEASSAVGARYAEQRCREERVYEVALVVLRTQRPRSPVDGEVIVERIESHKYSLYGFEVLGVHHIARYLQRVDMVARGEAVGEVAERVVLVVVGDGVGEVHGVCGVLLERVLQLHHYLLSCAFYFGCLQLRRRHHDFLRRVVHLDELVEVDLYLLRLDVHSLVGRRTGDDARRCLVVPSAVGLSHLGA